MKPGVKVLWNCRPGVLIPAIVAEITLTRVKIQVRKKDGSSVTRWVAPGRLQAAPSHKEGS